MFKKILVVVAVLVVLGVIFGRKRPEGDRSNPAVSKVSPETPVSPSVPPPVRPHRAGTGEITTVSLPDGGDVALAVSEAALDRFTHLSVANDSAGVEQMGAAGLLFLVPSGTHVRVISSGIMTFELRILDGPKTDQSCFVEAERVDKIQPGSNTTNPGDLTRNPPPLAPGHPGSRTARPRNVTTLSVPSQALVSGVLSKPDGSVLVADSEEHAERAFRFAAQKETLAISEGLAKGALWWLPARTRVKVLARDNDYAKVQVVDGPKSGKTCFVFEGFLENVPK